MHTDITEQRKSVSSLSDTFNDVCPDVLSSSHGMKRGSQLSFTEGREDRRNVFARDWPNLTFCTSSSSSESRPSNSEFLPRHSLDSQPSSAVEARRAAPRMLAADCILINAIVNGYASSSAATVLSRRINEPRSPSSSYGVASSHHEEESIQWR